MNPAMPAYGATPMMPNMMPGVAQMPMMPPMQCMATKSNCGLAELIDFKYDDTVET